MGINLDFDSLLSTALAQWPSRMDVTGLEKIADGSKRYYIANLDAIYNDIDLKCVGTEAEILWRSIHIAICSVLEDAAQFLNVIEVSALRADAIKPIFEENLGSCASSEYDLNWSAEDHTLASAYFAQCVRTVQVDC